MDRHANIILTPRSIVNVVTALLFCAIGSAASAEFCRVRIYDSAELDAGPVRLADIAEITTDDAEVKSCLEDFIVTQLACDADGSSLGFREISRILERGGVNPAAIGIYGASVCRMVLTSQKNPVSSDSDKVAIMAGAGVCEITTDAAARVGSQITLADKLTELVVLSTELDASRLIIDWDYRHRQFLQQPYDERLFQIKPCSSLTLGRVILEITETSLAQGRSGGTPSENPPVGSSVAVRENRPVRISGNVQYLCESVEAVRPLQAGHVITEADVKVVPRRVISLMNSPISDINMVIGKQVARPIATDKAIQPAMLRRLLLVNRNDRVDVQAGCRGVQITTKGIALSDGALGDVILVCSEMDNPSDLKSKKTVINFRSKVAGPGVVIALSNGVETAASEFGAVGDQTERDRLLLGGKE